MDAVTLALIKSMAGNGGGGSSLPSVTSADNGKVLAAQDGAWAAQGDIVLTGTYSNSVISITTNPLPSEDVIKNAYESGRGVVVRLGNDETYEIYRATPFSTSNLNITNAYTFGGIGEDFDGYKKRFYIDFFYSDSDPVVSAYLIQDRKFIVTLTPTAIDYSGTMDKTVAEINAAYEAGMEIWFKLEASGVGYLMEMAGIGNSDPESTYPSFNAKFIANNTLMYVGSEYTNDGTKQTYSTHIYTLTPAS